jgi:hypothetical protein
MPNLPRGTKHRRFILAAVLATLVLAIFSWFKPVRVANEVAPPPKPKGGSATLQNSSPPSSAQSADIPDPNDPRLTRLPDGRVFYNPSVEASRMISPSITPEESLNVISQILGHYRYAYQENPVGENSEITDRLLGNNPRKIVFIAPDCEALRGGMLVDPWGTPLFFHALSAEQMDVASAGSDREFWTADDLTTGAGPTVDP